MAQDVDSEDVEVVTEEDVEQEELSDRVGRVQDLDEEVAERQIVAVQLAVDEYTDPGQDLHDPGRTSGSVRTMNEEVAIQQMDRVL